MSSVSIRRNVSSILSAPLTARVAPLTAGGPLLCELAGALSAPASRLLESHFSRESFLREIAALREPAATLPASAAGLPPLEALKVSGLLAARNALFDEASEPLVTAHLRALVNSTSPVQAKTERMRLERVLEATHHAAFRGAAALAWKNAAIASGFTMADGAEALGASAETLRMTATDEAGRVLAGELLTEKDGTVTVSTEVAGIHDNSCGQVLDRFEQALEKQGVRSQSPQRRLTGGVAQLEAARRFLARRPRPTQSLTVPTAATPQRARRRPRPTAVIARR